MSNKFVITIPTFNAEKYIARAINSALNQVYDNYEVIIVDDQSSDKTWDIIYDVCYYHPNKDKIKSIRRNRNRIGVLANHYQMAQLCNEDEIIVNLDGDDELAGNLVLQKLDNTYLDPDVWITYGSFAYDMESRNPDPHADPRGFLSKAPDDRHDRSYPFIFSHLRTYKTWLFNNINVEDFKRDGQFYQMAPDLALMYPMIEMAGPQHARYIHEILYLYNACNPLNEHTHLGTDTVMETARYIQTQPRYPLLGSKRKI